MSDKRFSPSHKMNINKLRGQPSSISMPSFRFNVGDDDLEEVEPEIEEVFKEEDELAAKEPENVDCSSPSVVSTHPTSSSSQSSSSSASRSSRSISLDSSASPPGVCESDSKSLFSGIKESVRDKFAKTAKNLEEKIGMEIPGSAALGRKLNDRVGLETMPENEKLEVEATLTRVPKPPRELKLMSSVSNEPKNDESNKSSPILPIATPIKGWPSNDALNDVFKLPEGENVAKQQPKQGSGGSAFQPVNNRRKNSGGKSSSVTMSMSSLISPKAVMDEGEELTEDWEFVDLPKKSEEPSSEVQTAESPDKIASSKDVRWWNKYSNKFSDTYHKHLVLWSVVVAVYCILPLSSFVSGLIIGVIFSVMCGPTVQWLLFPVKRGVPEWVTDINVMYTPENSNIDLQTNKDEFPKVWMNELAGEYSPENYHINQTKSVYIRLEGKTLRMSWPHTGVPKRATWDELKYDPVFIRQRYIDLTGSQVLLKPEGLAKKRFWSKKYPICLVVNEESKNSSSDSLEEQLIYLFARTSREKEEWFRRFKDSSTVTSIQEEVNVEDKNVTRHKRSSSSESCHSIKHTSQLTIQDFHNHILTLCSITSVNSKAATSEKFTLPSHITRRSLSHDPLPVYDATWMNAFLGRVLWDFMIEESWSKVVADKIQKKLSKIKVPYFIEELTLTEIELGDSLPTINKVTKPYMNERGLWTHFDIVYSGSFCMTLETKLNLMRLKKSYLGSEGGNEELKESFEQEMEVTAGKEERSASLRAQLYDSDAEDSAESSSDEESPGMTEPLADDSGLSLAARAQNTYHRHVGSLLKKPLNKEVVRSSLQSLAYQTTGMGGSTSKKLLRIVDKIAQSKYFQQATDIKYVKKKMEEVSNTRLLLTVEVHNLAGTLAVNIPPPPTDRLWYGFHGNPKLWISARPKLGERQVTITHITEWIEKKLAVEFQRVLVMPNMDDLIIPVMDAKLR